MMSKPREMGQISKHDQKLGVDLMGECDITKGLEEFSADLLRMESALFFPTGVMANLCAVMSQVKPFEEVIVGRTSHIFAHEGAGVSVLGGIPIKTINDETGLLNIKELKSSIGDGQFFSTKTGLLCIENPHNDAAGIAHRPEAMEEILDIAKDYNLPVHLDGARLFNACAKYDVEPWRYTENVRSAMFCLNKGLGCPGGAILSSSRDVIEKARSIRKLLGGGICQPEILSQYGLKALKSGWEYLKQDNNNASLFISNLKDNKNFSIKPDGKETNIAYIYLKNRKKKALDYIPEFEELGIKLLANDDAFRVVFHSQMSAQQVEKVSHAFTSIIS